jgi:GAF domain
MPASGGEPRAEELARHYPRPLDHTTVGGQAMLTKQVAQYSLDKGAVAPSATQVFARGFAISSVLAAPMIHNGKVIGAIGAARETKPFEDKEVALVKAFADQAVIAIENTRLFEEVQARTRELTESLEQQTATADVLKVISRSALDVQKVLDALVESAARLCNAHDAAIFQVFGDGLRLVAHHGQIPTIGPVGQLTIPLAISMSCRRSRSETTSSLSVTFRFPRPLVWTRILADVHWGGLHASRRIDCWCTARYPR